MPNIKISDLNPSEQQNNYFLTNLSEEETDEILGGCPRRKAAAFFGGFLGYFSGVGALTGAGIGWELVDCKESSGLAPSLGPDLSEPPLKLK